MADQEIEFSVEDRSRYVRALYAYEAKDDTQLSINPGDILEVFYRDDSGWWDGKNVSNQDDGYFPGAVKIKYSPYLFCAFVVIFTYLSIISSIQNL